LITSASVTNEAGRIILRATDVANITTGSVTDAGNGGDIKVWSDQSSFVHGELKAQYGHIETSGKYLDISGIKVDAAGGTWLLDPTDITIGATDAGYTPSGGNPNSFTSVGATSTVSAATLNGVLNAGTSVILDTTGAGGTGNITLLTGNAISKTLGGNASLTLLAHNNIDIQAGSSITSTVGTLNVNLHANNAGSTTGAVTIGGTISTNGGNVDIVGPVGISINNAVNSGAGTITANSGAGIAIGATGSLNSLAVGNSVVLSAGTSFTNSAGAGSISAASGRWLVYSSNPAVDTFGSLNSANMALWNKTFTTYAPASVIETGNRYLFANQPLLTVTANSASKVYGNTVALTSTVTGLVNAATYGSVFTQDVYSGSATLSSAGTALTAGVAGAPYAITATAGSFSAPVGYGVTSYVNGTLQVTARPITATADVQTKVYGNADPLLTYVVGGSGLVNGDSLTGAQGRAAGENVGGYAINQGSLAASGNYTLAYTGNNLSITPATLTVAAAAGSKIYGDVDPALAFSATGFKFTDTAASLTGAQGRAAGENVGGYAINQGSLAASGNYTLAYTGNNLSITPATLTYTANTSTRTFGAAIPVFSGAISGLKGVDTLANATTGTNVWLSPATTASNPGAYAIDGSGLISNNGNYVFAQAIGNASAFSITPAPVVVVAPVVVPPPVVAPAAPAVAPAATSVVVTTALPILVSMVSKACNTATETGVAQDNKSVQINSPKPTTKVSPNAPASQFTCS
jgi:hypothetical protein